MWKNPAMLRRARKAFTLVEILIVVLILGILLAVAAPEFIRARDRSRATSCQANLKNVLGAKERWAMDNNKGPGDTPAMSDLVVPGVYLRSTPLCPTGGTYLLGTLAQMPRCSIGGTQGEYDAHVLP